MSPMGRARHTFKLGRWQKPFAPASPMRSFKLDGPGQLPPFMAGGFTVTHRIAAIPPAPAIE